MGPYTMQPTYPGYGAPYMNTAQQRLAQMEQQYPQFAQASPTPVMPAQNVTWIPVSGIQGAKDHIVQPNTTAWLMDNNDTIFYVKSSDNLGVTTLKAYRFQEIGVEEPQAVQPVIDQARYVSREEFEQLKSQLQQLISPQKKTDKEVQANV